MTFIELKVRMNLMAIGEKIQKGNIFEKGTSFE